MATNYLEIGQQNAEIAPQVSVKRTYDGRKQGALKRCKAHAIQGIKEGPKPKHRKYLSVRQFFKTLRGFDQVADAVELYKSAYEAKQFSLCHEMREACHNRLLGKPFTAENPDNKMKSNDLYQDHRVLTAIQNLHIHGAVPASANKALPVVLEGETGPEGQPGGDVEVIQAAAKPVGGQ